MKKIVFTILSLVLMMPSMAQTNFGSFFDRGIYYGLRLGLSLPTINSDEELLDGSSSKAGLCLGAVIGMQLSNTSPVYLESGLYYIEKGGKGYHYHQVAGSNNSNNKVNKKFTYDLNYLEIPIVVKYKAEIADDLTVQPFGGGYFALGIGGKIKNHEDKETSPSFSSDGFQRFDGGLRIGCGIEYQLIYAEAAYEWGLTNISHSDFESSHNNCFYLNLGVNF